MRKSVLLLLALVSVSIHPYAQPEKPLKVVLELQMSKTADDDMPGTRGASVVWHPVQKKYYASFAGNVGYPMCVFDQKGKRLSSDDLTTMADTRGLWYDPVSKKVTGNAYSEFGWFAYKLDKAGLPAEAEVVLDGMYQPGDQSVGVYNIAKKQLMFLHEGKVHIYTTTGDVKDSLVIHWGQKKGATADEHDDMDEDDIVYNPYSMIYTGVKGQELGFMNVIDKKIELYDISTGYLTKTLTLPEDAEVEEIFNFAYANGIYWLFSIEDRKWVGYK